MLNSPTRTSGTERALSEVTFPGYRRESSAVPFRRRTRDYLLRHTRAASSWAFAGNRT